MSRNTIRKVLAFHHKCKAKDIKLEKWHGGKPVYNYIVPNNKYIYSIFVNNQINWF